MSRRSRRRRQRERIRSAQAAKAQLASAKRERARRHGDARPASPSPAFDEGRSWHVVRTLPRWADRTCEALEKIDVVAFLPRWSEIRVRRNRRVVHHASLLPRSVFVGVRDEGHLAEACAVYGVVEPVRINGRVASIPSDEMRRFAYSLARGEVEQPVGIKAGDRVLVIDGPFSSFPGMVEEMVPEGVRVAVSIFGSVSPITMGLAQVQKLN